MLNHTHHQQQNCETIVHQGLKLTDLKTDAALARSELVNTVHQKLKLSLQVETTEDNLEEAIKERMKKRLCV